VRLSYRLGQTLRLEFWKYPEHRLHYWWTAQVAEVREGAVLLHMPVGFEFHHESRGKTVRVDHQGYVAFFEGGWYSGGPDLDGWGEVLEYYWNVQTPPVFEPERIWQYDLELDVRCKADHTCSVVDEDEFAAKTGVYPAAWVEASRRAVGEIQLHVQEGRWPVLPRGEDRGWLERP
jgi:protein associated with RNAse G/E